MGDGALYRNCFMATWNHNNTINRPKRCFYETLLQSCKFGSTLKKVIQRKSQRESFLKQFCTLSGGLSRGKNDFLDFPTYYLHGKDSFFDVLKV